MVFCVFIYISSCSERGTDPTPHHVYINHPTYIYTHTKEPLAPLYERWAAGDARMRQVAERIPGVRVVR